MEHACCQNMLRYIFATIQMDPMLSFLVVLSIGIILISFLFKILRQPSVIAYIIAGVVMGPYGLKVITDEALISSLGSYGLVLLLFFIGMEISIPKLLENWRITVVGTIAQVLFSLGMVWLFSVMFNWDLKHVIILGFVISLSSSAIIIGYLGDRNEINSQLGQKIIGILIIQDILVVPMLIIMTYTSGEPFSPLVLFKQIIGGLVILGISIWALRKDVIVLPLGKYIRKDYEIQVFIAFTFCFGFSLITAFFGLSSALGAFVAGMIVSKSKETAWVKTSMQAFRIVFVTLFFVSIGMLLDINFLLDNTGVVLILVLLAFVTNNLINTIIVRWQGESWKDSLYTGAILAQIGEFSFILGASASLSGMISDHTYQLIISTISVTLILSPLWILFIQKVTLFYQLLYRRWHPK
jgi:CPA2 family monovalent cation:H+ antiporter-2